MAVAQGLDLVCNKDFLLKSRSPYLGLGVFERWCKNFNGFSFHHFPGRRVCWQAGRSVNRHCEADFSFAEAISIEESAKIFSS
jgi:hypothetical protein